jgi:phage tail sheath gpL-like
MAATAARHGRRRGDHRQPNLPVTAAVNGGVPSKVDITAKNAGADRQRHRHPGQLPRRGLGEATPAGITPTIVAMAGGATNPTLTTALANLRTCRSSSSPAPTPTPRRWRR